MPELGVLLIIVAGIAVVFYYIYTYFPASTQGYEYAIAVMSMTLGVMTVTLLGSRKMR